MAAEFEKYGIGVNTLWPRTAIATAAVQNLLGGDESVRGSRTPDIMGDAAYIILTSDSRKTNGNFFLDDEVLVSTGVHDLEKYKVDKRVKDCDLVADFFC